ncbi:MAG TPA: tripartite tricarboxylate transporter substrate binding protein, partial [Chloroflexota bacterium]|nr:tripartite tricarboxylate transporter substrate binding protein [Chloroflexota bacterium]
VLVGVGLIAGMVGLSGCQGGAAYPSKPILFVVPYAPGGGSDIIIRTFDKIATEIKALPNPMVIENKAGGSGVTGKSYAKEKPADGYTIMTADDSTTFTALAGQTPWEYNDFTFLAKINRDYNLVVVKSDSPYKTMKELIEAAKAKPKTVKIGGTGVGQVDNIHVALIEKATGAKFTYLSFDSGGQVMTNLLGGQVESAMANPSEAYEQMRAGKVKALGISAAERQNFNDPMFKDIPTFKESGVDVAVAQWRGINGPKGMKKEHVDYLIAAIKKVCDSPQWKTEYNDKFMQVPTFVPGDEFKAEIDKEYATFKPIFQELGLYKGK